MCPAVDKSRGNGEDAVAYIRVERDLYARIVALAEENERTISGEIRLAIRRHIEAQKVAA